MNGVLVALSETATDSEIEDSAFKAFAYLHPHEAYESYPERFWQWFHTEMNPSMSREQMEAALKETASL